MQNTKVSKELYEKLKNLCTSELDEEGRELLNPVPLFIELDSKPISMKDQIQRIVVQELSAQAGMQGNETWEEANDFDVEDEDPDPVSPYEETEMTQEWIPKIPTNDKVNIAPVPGDQIVPEEQRTQEQLQLPNLPPAELPAPGSEAPSVGPVPAEQPKGKWTWIPED